MSLCILIQVYAGVIHMHQLRGNKKQFWSNKEASEGLFGMSPKSAFLIPSQHVWRLDTYKGSRRNGSIPWLCLYHPLNWSAGMEWRKPWPLLMTPELLFWVIATVTQPKFLWWSPGWMPFLVQVCGLHPGQKLTVQSFARTDYRLHSHATYFQMASLLIN